MKLQALLALAFAGAVTAQAASCPTVTSSAFCSSCPPIIADCIIDKTLDVPCGCTMPVQTTTTSLGCGPSIPCNYHGCAGIGYHFNVATGCPTVTPPPPPPKSTPVSSPCPTITSSVHDPSCTPKPPPGMSMCGAVPACALLQPVTVPCSCGHTSIPTVTVTSSCTCQTGCLTFSSPVYEPCVMTPSVVPTA